MTKSALADRFLFEIQAADLHAPGDRAFEAPNFVIRSTVETFNRFGTGFAFSRPGRGLFCSRSRLSLLSRRPTTTTTTTTTFRCNDQPSDSTNVFQVATRRSGPFLAATSASFLSALFPFRRFFSARCSFGTSSLLLTKTNGRDRDCSRTN